MKLKLSFEVHRPLVEQHSCTLNCGFREESIIIAAADSDSRGTNISRIEAAILLARFFFYKQSSFTTYALESEQKRKSWYY